MRQLPNSSEPKALTEARAKLIATPGNAGNWYELLPTSAKEAVREQRMKEQGALCAYTEISLLHEGHHIEHMYPRDHCSPEESISYDNMVLCFPRNRDPGYGAIPKGNWPDESQRAMFVRPTDPQCSTRFKFATDGRVDASNPNDFAALETIRRLNLNHQGLSGFRKQAMLSALKGLTKMRDVRARLSSLSTDREGNLPPFVSAREYALRYRLERLRVSIEKDSRQST